MKEKHINTWMKVCDVLSEQSECLRPGRKVGAVLVDPVNNTLLATGYNGYLRGGTTHCGGEGVCQRTLFGIKSGEKIEVGCIHAEENVIINAARQGITTVGMWIFVNADPCRLCSRRMVQAGIKRVVYRSIGYPTDGINILRENRVIVIEWK